MPCGYVTNASDRCNDHLWYGQLKIKSRAHLRWSSLIWNLLLIWDTNGLYPQYRDEASTNPQHWKGPQRSYPVSPRRGEMSLLRIHNQKLALRKICDQIHATSSEDLQIVHLAIFSRYWQKQLLILSSRIKVLPRPQIIPTDKSPKEH